MSSRGVSRPLVAVALAVAGVVGACGLTAPSPAPFDPQASIDLTEDALTARFSLASTIEIAGASREVARAEGVVDFVAGSGRREGQVATNPFPPPGGDLGIVDVETLTVDGTGFERETSAAAEGEWREVNGTMGSFLGLGNREATFRGALEEVLGPVGGWSAIGREEVRGESLSRHGGVAGGASRGPVEVWVDDAGRIRRLAVTRTGVPPTNATGVHALELWDFGVEVSVERPEM